MPKLRCQVIGFEYFFIWSRLTCMRIHPICALPLLVCLVLSAKAPVGEHKVIELMHTVLPDRELLILVPAVAFSIGHLFDELVLNGDGSSMMR